MHIVVENDNQVRLLGGFGCVFWQRPESAKSLDDRRSELLRRELHHAPDDGDDW